MVIWEAVYVVVLESLGCSSIIKFEEAPKLRLMAKHVTIVLPSAISDHTKSAL